MLKKSCEVRWSSLYLMLSSFLENRRAIALLQIDNPKLNLPIIDSREWDVIDLLCEVLKPLAETTKAVQSRFEATASVVIPSLKLLEFKLNRMKREE